MGQNDDEMELCLKWNNFECTVTSAFHNFHGAGELVDVTLAAEGQQLKAHRLVLAACSPYFRDVFKKNPCDHPIIILREVRMVELKRVLLFMYQGQVNVPHTSLTEFIRLAEALKIRGLTDSATLSEHPKETCNEDSVSKSSTTASEIKLLGRNKRPRCEMEGNSSKRARVESPAAEEHDPSPLQRSLSQSPQFKAEIQDMLEVKLEPGHSPDIAASGEGVGGVVTPYEGAQCVSPCSSSVPLCGSVSPSSSNAPHYPTPAPACIAPSSPTSSPQDPTNIDAAAPNNVFILPKPFELPSHQTLGCLKSTNNLQPEFPLDPASLNLPYPCPFCDKAYMSWGFRRRHIKGCHTKSQKLPCKWCLHVLPSRLHWEAHVTQHHQLSEVAARNGLLILEEANMVLQFAAPTRITSIIDLIKDKKTTTEQASSTATNPVLATTSSTTAATTITPTTTAAAAATTTTLGQEKEQKEKTTEEESAPPALRPPSPSGGSVSTTSSGRATRSNTDSKRNKDATQVYTYQKMCLPSK